MALRRAARASGDVFASLSAPDFASLAGRVDDEAERRRRALEVVTRAGDQLLESIGRPRPRAQIGFPSAHESDGTPAGRPRPGCLCGSCTATRLGKP